MSRRFIITGVFFLSVLRLAAQQEYELNSGWVCTAIKNVSQEGSQISRTSFSTAGWQAATVPGTVLTTMLNNGQVPDPLYGMNNKKIPDIYETGRDYYTYWFVKDFKETGGGNQQVWLNLRGVNYGCDVYLNGRRLNAQTHKGMYLRQHYNITTLLAKDGNNRVAVIVYPPDPVGNPNGGQGGDGEIARNVSHQYVAGWDWIQPICDRNTGIWDKVTIEKTNLVDVKNPHVVTLVPGVRFPGAIQQPAVIKASAEVENPGAAPLTGTLQYEIDGKISKRQVTLKPGQTTEVSLPDLLLNNPRLWWPNGYGKQELYNIRFRFVKGSTVCDEEDVLTGIRQVQTRWNDQTMSREVAVNGQKVFVKGGNWIISDAMLRFTKERYDAEVRFHRDMNLNLIRIWGGALTERPEFYEACDKYGMLVFQDFWFSGDCNGRWLDPLKKEDQWTRRQYPDDHSLALESLADQLKMIRNHPSLAFYCGGNEITPPDDILTPLKKDLLPHLDSTRFLFDYSNSAEMSYNTIGGNGDGPYGIQDIATFWDLRTFPFNSEVGSVGVGDYESLERFIPKENLVAPQFTNGRNVVDSVWDYHKYIGYDQYMLPYGNVTDARDFANKAQLINYDQYRGLIEGFSSHMWDWYTGVIIWKTQNPWTALRGQMYDYYLDPNACLYGLRKAGEPLHVMYNPVTGMVMVENNTFSTQRNLMLELKTYDMQGKDSLLTQVFIEVGPSSVQKILSLKPAIEKLGKKDGVFLSARLLTLYKKPVSENLYWFADEHGNYSGLQKMQGAPISFVAKPAGKGKIEVTISNPTGAPIAFFNRVSLVDASSKKRVLPAFYSDNYLSVLPSQRKTVTIDYTAATAIAGLQVSIRGWNVKEQFVSITP